MLDTDMEYVIQITGTRWCEDYDIVKECIEGTLSYFKIPKKQVILFVSGHCRGVDNTSEEWARRNNISVCKMPAEWDKYGKAAGPRRNCEMIQFCLANFEKDAIIGIAMYIEGGNGTQHMMAEMRKAGIRKRFWKLSRK